MHDVRPSIWLVVTLMLTTAVLAHQTRPPLCKMPKVRGLCRGSIPRWFYNTDTSLCEKFIYGGLQGEREQLRDGGRV
ncbi:hypothetical protein LSAT2_008317 [Lamellibrachia satsuma]|nr:hypothetical protein LSAT2_008317 [Lamellibrachia satsuma]